MVYIFGNAAKIYANYRGMRCVWLWHWSRNWWHCQEYSFSGDKKHKVNIVENGMNGIGQFNYSYHIENFDRKNSYVFSIESLTRTALLQYHFLFHAHAKQVFQFTAACTDEPLEESSFATSAFYKSSSYFKYMHCKCSNWQWVHQHFVNYVLTTQHLPHGERFTCQPTGSWVHRAIGIIYIRHLASSYISHLYDIWI